VAVQQVACRNVVFDLASFVILKANPNRPALQRPDAQSARLANVVHRLENTYDAGVLPQERQDG
jgi:hypothetical protein